MTFFAAEKNSKNQLALKQEPIKFDLLLTGERNFSQKLCSIELSDVFFIFLRRDIKSAFQLFLIKFQK